MAQEEEEKVQEEEEGDPCKGGTFGIQFEMCSPLICSGHWRVVRGFALVCVCVHVCLPVGVCVCVRVCMSERTAQAVTYTAAETTEGVGGGPEPTKQRQEEGGKVPGAALIGSAPHHTRTHTHRHTHKHTHTHTYVQPLHSPPPPPPHLLHICWSVKGRMERRGEEKEEGIVSPPNPSPLLSSDGPLPAQQIGLIAQKNLPTCVERGGKKKKKKRERVFPKHTGQSILSALMGACYCE